jgi:Peptidase family M41
MPRAVRPVRLLLADPLDVRHMGLVDDPPAAVQWSKQPNIGDRDPFLGREIAAPKEYAESTASRIDAAVVDLLERARQQARAALEEHRAVLDAVADELIARETVSGPRLAEIAGEIRDRPSAEGKGIAAA